MKKEVFELIIAIAEQEAKKRIILDIFSRAIDHGLLAEVCESILESDAPNDVEAALEAAREWDLTLK